MLRILHGTNYDFIKVWRLMVAITVAFIVVGLGMVVNRVVQGRPAINKSIEFSGGTLMQLKFAKPPGDDGLRKVLDAAGYGHAEIQQFGSPLEYTVRARLGTGEMSAAQGDSMSAQIGRALTATY